MTTGARMKDARRNESEAMYKGPYWVFVSVLTGMPLKVEKCTFKPTIHPAGSHGDWIEMWADSHPDTAESDEGPYRYSHPKLKAAFDEGYAHARKSQAAEIARMRELLERAWRLLPSTVEKGSDLDEFYTDYAELKKGLG